MNISSSINMYNHSHNSAGQKPKKESSGIRFPAIGENGMIQGDDIRTLVRALPEGIGLTDEEVMDRLFPNRANKIFEFGEDGSTRILPGLSREDYLRARALLREWELWMRGH